MVIYYKSLLFITTKILLIIPLMEDLCLANIGTEEKWLLKKKGEN